MKSLIMAAIMAVIISSSTSAESVTYPVGTVITVTEEGVLVTTSASNNPDTVDTDTDTDTDTASSTNTDTTVYVDVDESEYCYGADYSLVDCEPSRNYDPWIASTGEKHYFLRNQLTLSIPFTLPARNDSQTQAGITRYGYFQMTAPMRRRDPVTEDIFHVWFSEEPNGEPISGEKCEKWMIQARGYFYWTQDESLSSQACYLGQESKLLYANFETACYAPRYEGQCSDTNKQKSYNTYQFDVARAVRGY